MIRTTTLFATAMLIACASCSSGNLTEPPAIHASPPSEASVSAELPIRFEVTERAGVPRPNELVEAGVPFARGVVQPDSLPAVHNADGSVPAKLRPLAHWPDGSVRWAKVELPVRLAASETKQFSLVRGEALPHAFSAPALPNMTLELVTETKRANFPITPTAMKVQGKQAIEVEIEPLTATSARVRVTLAQVEGNDQWRTLTFKVAGQRASCIAGTGAGSAGAWSAAVRYAKERDQAQCEASGDELQLHLFNATGRPYPADEGFHVTHEIILEQSAQAGSLASRVAAPTRIDLSPHYIDATRAMGRISPADNDSRGVDAAFEGSWESIRQQQTLPKNRGWTVWGDFNVRGHGLAYAGFLNQEYDPAMGFYLYSARTGNQEALDTALAMTHQFANNGVSLRGGCYQHRATLQAVERCIAEAVGAKIRVECSVENGGEEEEARLVGAIQTQYGDKTATKVANWLRDGRTETALGRIKRVSNQFGHALIVATREEAAKDSSDLAARLARPNASIRDYASYVCAEQFISSYEIPEIDSLFRNFFARYGGSWENFPAFHFCDLPDTTVSHSSGHTLVGMLVQGHLATGDPSLRRAALNVGRYLIEGGLIQDGIDEVRSQVQRSQRIHARMVGWPLLCLMALKPLTEHSDPELDALFDKNINELLQVILELPTNNYDSLLHAGLVSEGLARLHEETGSEEARDYLLELVWFWSASQWRESQNAFNYKPHGGEVAAPAICGLMLYGVAYSAWLTQDPMLASRARATKALLAERPETYVKEIAQKFRSSQRALSLLPSLPQ